jgi:hypothetical protein
MVSTRIGHVKNCCNRWSGKRVRGAKIFDTGSCIGVMIRNISRFMMTAFRVDSSKYSFQMIAQTVSACPCYERYCRVIGSKD